MSLCCSGTVTPHGHRKHLQGTDNHTFCYEDTLNRPLCCCGQTVIFEFEKEESVTDNPFKVGDKVQYMDRSNVYVHTVLAMHGEFLWLDNDDRVPYTVRAEYYVKAEEPIEAGQWWKRVGDSYQAVVEGVTDKHVVYSTTLDDRLLVRTIASFRKEYTR